MHLTMYGNKGSMPQNALYLHTVIWVLQKVNNEQDGKNLGKN